MICKQPRESQIQEQEAPLGTSQLHPVISPDISDGEEDLVERERKDQ